MYDADTARLIQSSPSLDGLNRERLPEVLSDAFAKIAAARFRLRDGDATDDQELIELIAEMQRLALTNEILVAVSPAREDRAAAAFVAGSAHQLCFNARRIGTASEEPATYVDANGISSDIAAMLLFLVSEATADSGELANRIDVVDTAPTGDKAKLQSAPMGLFSLKQTWATRDTQDYALLGLLENAVQLAANKWWGLTPNSGVVSAAIASAASESGVKTLVFFQTIQNAVSAKNRISEELGEVEIEMTEEELRWLAVSQLEMGGEDCLFLDVEGGKLTSTCVVHHGLLLPEERQLCESIYQRSDGATVMAATSTVSQGMNFPSELVIIAEDSRFDEAKDRREVLQAQELLNAAGRAGRAGQTANGIVLVIPGKVVGIDMEDAKIGKHWSKLQSVFGQSDQCLDIDDPLTAIFDRVHANTLEKSEVDRYAITRLASVGLENSVNKSLSGFRARKRGDDKWIQDRLEAAVAYQAKEKPESERDLAEHQVASTLGIALAVMERLSEALANSDDNHTVADWRRWFFKWIGANGDLFDQIFRRETIDDLFGKSVKDLEDSSDRCKAALPYLKRLTKLWMQGKPLSDLELALDTPADKLKTCIGARKFVLRVLPELSYLFGVPALLRQRQSADDDKPAFLSPALTKLNACVRRGYHCYEQAALGYELRAEKLSRRQLHAKFEELKPHLQAAADNETWEQAIERIDAARAIALLPA